MDKPASSSVGISNRKQGPFAAPTPQNTPSTPAPIASNFHPSISSIAEIGEAGRSGEKSNILSFARGRFGKCSMAESLPISVKRRIHGLQCLQQKHSELEGRFQEEVLALEKKYLALYMPLYTKRAQVVQGLYEPTNEEVALGEETDRDSDGASGGIKLPKYETSAHGDEKDDVRGIPEFWLTTLKNHPQISEIITHQDEGALRHLIDIRLSYMDRPGFRLEFEFADGNEYFTDKVLTKTYYYQDQAYDGDFVYDHAEGCTIHWKEGKDLTFKIETKKQRHKGTNKTRVVKRTVPADTFFRFFSPPEFPNSEEGLDVEEAEGLDAKLEVDYETGEEFKDKIIPRAIDYFTGKALEYEDFDEVR
ncbi:hypothetical protein BX666DRAFT_1952499 [Dichotomocladium elegans]|nr:hypothetical protein BX666DRAFT_1952499 [Dichotomocladium elegans]